MATQEKKLTATQPRKVHAQNREAVQIAANSHIVRHYPIGCLGGRPQRLVGKSGNLWLVPIVLTSPGYGPVGQVGVVIVDGTTRQILGATERREAGLAIEQLREGKRDELDAAFHRARKR